MLKKPYKMIYGIFPTLWCCLLCGAAIWDKDIHDKVECDVVG